MYVLADGWWSTGSRFEETGRAGDRLCVLRSKGGGDQLRNANGPEGGKEWTDGVRRKERNMETERQARPKSKREKVWGAESERANCQIVRGEKQLAETASKHAHVTESRERRSQRRRTM